MATCPNCGQESKEGARFCNRCGAALAESGQPPAGTPAAPAAYAPKTVRRRPVFWVGAAIVVLSGILVLASSFLPWVSGSSDSSGWNMLEYAEGSEYFYQDLGTPFFTGLCSLIAVILMLIAGALMIAARNRGLAARPRSSPSSPSGWR